MAIVAGAAPSEAPVFTGASPTTYNSLAGGERCALVGLIIRNLSGSPRA